MYVSWLPGVPRLLSPCCSCPADVRNMPPATTSDPAHQAVGWRNPYAIHSVHIILVLCCTVLSSLPTCHLYTEFLSCVRIRMWDRLDSKQFLHRAVLFRHFDALIDFARISTVVSLPIAFACHLGAAYAFANVIKVGHRTRMSNLLWMRRRRIMQSKSTRTPVQDSDDCGTSSSGNVVLTQSHGQRIRCVVTLCVLLALSLAQSILVYSRIFISQVCLLIFVLRCVGSSFQIRRQNGSLGFSCVCVPERTDDCDSLVDCHSWNKSCRSSSSTIFLSPCSSSCLSESSVSQGFVGSVNHSPSSEHSCCS
jgi:hypothetical protein